VGEGVVGGFLFVVGVSGAGDEVFVVGFSKYFCGEFLEIFFVIVPGSFLVKGFEVFECVFDITRFSECLRVMGVDSEFVGGDSQFLEQFFQQFVFAFTSYAGPYGDWTAVEIDGAHAPANVVFPFQNEETVLGVAFYYFVCRI